MCMTITPETHKTSFSISFIILERYCTVYNIFKQIDNKILLTC